MFTVCPKCALTLVVTAADLRVAQGYVRCGRCSSVFNALARLSDERQAAATAAEPEAPPEAPDTDLSPLEAALSGAAPPAAEEPIPEDALEFDAERTDLGAVFVEPPPNPQWTAATGSFRAMQAGTQPAAAAVDVEIDAALLAEMLQPEQTTTEPTPTAASQRAATPDAPAPASTSTRAAASTPARAAAVAAVAPERPPAASADEEEEEEEEDEYAIGQVAAAPRSWEPRLGAYAWGGGAVLALLVLLAQILDHNRDDLAADPRFNSALTAFYGALGVQLVPRWDLRAYDVRQLGASADPAGSGLITVRASVKNAGRQAQPLPLLRVTLQDRFGNRIAARDVAPRFYVPHTMPDSSYLAGGQRIDAEMGFVDPGTNAVGFEIDACLPARGGGVTCANDLAAR